jgi:para-nitrobenzyl esterase
MALRMTVRCGCGQRANRTVILNRIGRALLGLFMTAFPQQQTAAQQLSGTVMIDTGEVRGVTLNGVESFKGMPYASPPIGTLRWRIPQPPKPWRDVLLADRFGPACMQTDDVPKSEDCLTLNLWRPTVSSPRPQPVMVWIYGGALIEGGTSFYPADALAKQGVIVVSMNYRVGRLGFFAHAALVAEAPNEVIGTMDTWINLLLCNGYSEISRHLEATRTQ